MQYSSLLDRRMQISHTFMGYTLSTRFWEGLLLAHHLLVCLSIHLFSCVCWAIALCSAWCQALGIEKVQGLQRAEMSQGYQLRALVLTAFVLVAVVGLPSLTLALGIQIWHSCPTLGLVEGPRGWGDHIWCSGLLLVQWGTSYEENEGLQPFLGDKEVFWEGHLSDEAVTCDLGRPKLPARVDSGWTHCGMDFSAPVNWTPKVSPPFFLLGCQCPVQGKRVQRQLPAMIALMILASSMGTPHPHTLPFELLCLQTLICLENFIPFCPEAREKGWEHAGMHC